MLLFDLPRRSAVIGLLVAITLGNTALAGTFPVDRRQDLDVIEAQVRASQFLMRATFGPTKDTIQSLADRIELLGARAAFEEWIDDQFVLPATSHHARAKEMIIEDGWPNFITGGMSTTVYRHYAWWDTAITADDQLRQRMAWALAQIFVINGTFNSRRLDASGEPRYLGVVDYYDMLVDNAFGNYRTTLEDVTRHPVMGNFLSHLRNRKADPVAGTYPDENYGREAQQLLSIGLYLIKRNGDYLTDRYKDPIPSYDNDDILTFARVFTGLDYSAETGRSLNLHAPMDMVEAWHDTDEKVLHNGTILPPGQTGDEDLADALDNLFEHPNTGPFIARLLIQRFVKSNPTNRYIDAVAAAFNDNGAGVRGDFEAVIKEILLNKEALESYSFSTKRKPLGLLVEGGGTEHSRLQEPVLRYAALVRAFGGVSTHPSGHFSIPDRSHWLNQEAYQAPHVFNFYLPNHVPGGELQDFRPKGRVPNRTIYAPEFEILTSVAANRIANIFRADVRDAELDLVVRQYDMASATYGNVFFKILLDFTDETLLAGDPDQLLQHLDILLCHGSMSDAARSSLAGIVEAATTNPEERAKGAVLALLTAPDCVVHG